jgi:hypothetical protein
MCVQNTKRDRDVSGKTELTCDSVVQEPTGDKNGPPPEARCI